MLGDRYGGHHSGFRKSMKTGERWSCWKSSLAWLFLAVPALVVPLSGCAKDRASVEQHLLAEYPSALHLEGVTESYRVGCPDEIEVQLAYQHALSGRYEIAPNGKI